MGLRGLLLMLLVSSKSQMAVLLDHLDCEPLLTIPCDPLQYLSISHRQLFARPTPLRVQMFHLRLALPPRQINLATQTSCLTMAAPILRS